MGQIVNTIESDDKVFKAVITLEESGMYSVHHYKNGNHIDIDDSHLDLFPTEEVAEEVSRMWIKDQKVLAPVDLLYWNMRKDATTS